VVGDLAKASRANSSSEFEDSSGARPVVQNLRQRSAADQYVAQAGRRRHAGFQQAGQHGRHQREMGDRLARQVGGYRVGGETVMQQHGSPGARAAPEDGKAANMMQRQAVQPEIAGR